MSKRIEFGKRQAANQVRDEFSEHITGELDRRHKALYIADDTPREAKREIESRAAASRARQESGPGQAPLTDAEKKRFDFSKDKMNVLKARSIKAVFQDEGVDDWLSFVDPTLTVSEHYQIAEEAKRQERGQRKDAQESDEERIRRLRNQQGAAECDHAEDHCVMGDQDACEFLRDECGFDEEDVQTILELEAEAEQEISGEAAGALKRSWQGYKGSIATLDDVLEDLDEEWHHAQQAAKAINRVREQHGQQPLHFHRLERLQADLDELVHGMSEDCSECHGVHREGHSPGSIGRDTEEDTEA